MRYGNTTLSRLEVNPVTGYISRYFSVFRSLSGIITKSKSEISISYIEKGMVKKQFTCNTHVIQR